MLCGPAIVNFLCLTSFNNHNNTKKNSRFYLRWVAAFIAARLVTFLVFSTQCSKHLYALYAHVTRGCVDCWSVVRSVLCMGWYCDRCITDTPHTLWSRFCHLTKLQINKIKRICKFASRFWKFSCALQGVLGIILILQGIAKKKLQIYQVKIFFWKFLKIF